MSERKVLNVSKTVDHRKKEKNGYPYIYTNLLLFTLFIEILST